CRLDRLRLDVAFAANRRIERAHEPQVLPQAATNTNVVHRFRSVGTRSLDDRIEGQRAQAFAEHADHSLVSIRDADAASAERTFRIEDAANKAAQPVAVAVIRPLDQTGDRGYRSP